MSIEQSSQPELQYFGDELSLFAHAQNWKAYWSSKLKPMINGEVLEVGAGIGTNLSMLRQTGQLWTALEPDHAQAKQIQESLAPQDKEHINVVAGTLANIPAEQKFDSIIYIDVLEHIEDDQAEVIRALSHLRDGGRLIVLSPAHNSLFSPFDKAVGHFRRYNKASLSELTPKEDSDVKEEHLFYLDSVGCLASLANAKILSASMPTPKQIWLWDKLMVPISRLTDKLTAHRIGKTIVMVWKKT